VKVVMNKFRSIKDYKNLKTLKSIIFISLLLLFFCDKNIGQSFSYEEAYKSGIVKTKLDFSIGGDTDIPSEMLIEPSIVRVDNNGNIFILDSKDYCIKKYDKNGKLLKKFGRNGSGPGEFNMCNSLEIGPNGDIFIFDLMNFRFTVFSNNGEYLRTKNVNYVVRKFRVSQFGIYIETREKSNATNSIGDTIIVTQYSQNFKKRKEIFRYYQKSNIYFRGKKTRSNMPIPFHETAIWVISRGCNIIVAFTDGYKIRTYSPNGGLIREFTHSGEKERVTEKDKSKYFAGITNWSSKGSESRGASKFIRDNTEFPDYKPNFRELHIDSEGNILLTTYKKKGKYLLVDVFREKGEFIEQVKIAEDVLRYGSLLKDGYILSNYGGDNLFGEVKKFKVVY